MKSINQKKSGRENACTTSSDTRETVNRRTSSLTRNFKRRIRKKKKKHETQTNFQNPNEHAKLRETKESTIRNNRPFLRLDNGTTLSSSVATSSVIKKKMATVGR